MGLRLLAITTTMLTGAIFAAQPALAQKHGGTLKYYHRDNPPTTSIHEEATISTVNPFMAVFNNLVLFDQSKPREGLDTIVPDLAESWSWSEDGKRITFKLRQGVKWHDGQPFTSKDVGCTFDLLLGKAKDGLRLNPRQGLVSERGERQAGRRFRGHARAQGAAAILARHAGVRLLPDISLPRLPTGNADEADRDRTVPVR